MRKTVRQSAVKRKRNGYGLVTPTEIQGEILVPRDRRSGYAGFASRRNWLVFMPQPPEMQRFVAFLANPSRFLQCAPKRAEMRHKRTLFGYWLVTRFLSC